MGCTIKFSKEGGEDPPVNPESELNLVRKLKPRPQGPGKFNAGSYTIPKSTEYDENLPLTTFIIRVEYNGQYYYYIQVCLLNCLVFIPFKKF